MKLKSEHNLSLQKYKIAYEEREIVKSVFEDGLRDLNAHLVLFQERLTDDIENQKERFNKFFFGNENKVEEKSESNSESFTKKPAWAKKAYRSIALVTHPDKSSFIPVDSVRKKFAKYYQIAVNSYEKEEYENLLFIASDLGIEIEEDSVFDMIDPKLKKIQKEIDQMKASNAYNWASIEKERRPEVLENYMKSMGFVFAREKVEEVIEEVKRIKRKVGTRPVNHIRQRLKSQ